jgi:hypothetical protein
MRRKGKFNWTRKKKIPKSCDNTFIGAKAQLATTLDAPAGPWLDVMVKSLTKSMI